MEVNTAIRLQDWEKMAVMQPDSSDTNLFLHYSQDTSFVKTAAATAGEPTIFGTTALRHFDWPASFLEEFQHAPFDHPSIKKAEELLKLWPEAYHQIGALITAFNPVLIKGVVDSEDYAGSNSHQPKNTLGAIWATVHNPLLLAQALVHEMAHNKLFCLGQHFESKLPLFINGDEELFDSPIRLDIPRPMAALFHGVYAFTHVLKLDRILYQQKPNLKNTLLSLMLHNALRLKKGIEIISKNAKLTDQGKAFVNSFIPWALDEINSCLNICKKEIQQKKNNPIVIIGPDSPEKYQLASSLAKHGQKDIVYSKEVCLEIWSKSAVIQKKQIALYGSEEVAKIFRNSTKFSTQEMLQNWMNTGVLDLEEIEFMQLQLHHFLLTEQSDKILCLSAEHSFFTNSSFLNRLLQFYRDLGAKVIYARPNLPIESAVSFLQQEDSQRSRAELYQQLYHPSYRTLSNFTYDSTRIETEALQELIQTIA
ncbi:aKG-HExxH-type peptide beta-hydroxylase [Aquimarina brevivitae]|uniref:HEXXH motif-containing protein n=1 Tax=Aquimarina brevivitae TaxID=323412 RepID=A0A4Q7PGC6_9FLAO|nr:HEXXH motif-containing putative peptide modification protein [Aquimarina brevivitae]RZS99197.1 HEXXH motif-containing protein [Aquimarina brevivitae]